MARDPHIEERLHRWAQAVTVGNGSGYPVMSVLHEDWMPPSPGVTPTLKSSPHTDVWATHKAVGRLSLKARNAVVVHYCLRLQPAVAADRLECAVDTLHARIETAHRELLVLLCGGADRVMQQPLTGLHSGTLGDFRP